jgi:hypothetical protein
MKNEEFLWFFVVEQKNDEVFAVVTFRVLKNEERRTISDSHKRVITKSLEMIFGEYSSRHVETLLKEWK